MVRTILVVGAGKSTSYLLDYLLKKSNEENIHLKIGDISLLQRLLQEEGKGGGRAKGSGRGKGGGKGSARSGGQGRANYQGL